MSSPVVWQFGRIFLHAFPAHDPGKLGHGNCPSRMRAFSLCDHVFYSLYIAERVYNNEPFIAIIINATTEKQGAGNQKQEQGEMEAEQAAQLEEEDKFLLVCEQLKLLNESVNEIKANLQTRKNDKNCPQKVLPAAG